MRVGPAQLAHAASVLPAWLRFERDAAAPQRAQLRQLRAALGQVAGTAYGERHGLHAELTLEQFRERTPIVDHAALAPWTERIASGEQRVLTRQPVTHFERTSGGAAASKLIPFTPLLLQQFAHATDAWLADLYRHFPSLFGSRSYWSISPAGQRSTLTAGGVAVGSADDTRYLGPVAGWAQRQLLAVPLAVARNSDVEQWRHETARQLLASADLGLISVWSPTFLSGLLVHIQEQLAALLVELPAPRRRAIERGLALRGALHGDAIWPRLALISCWMDATSARFADALRAWFPRTPFQAKGLLATEGVISFPLWNHDGAVLAVGSHFFEFVDLARPDAVPLLAHELQSGARYAPLLTTGGGLYRYRIGDAVECVGAFRATPLVRFVGRVDRVSDLCGEKLDALLVEQALAAVATPGQPSWRFAMLAPELAAIPHYTLFLDSDRDDDQLAAAARALDDQLGRVHHYAVCRRLGQLGPLQAQRVAHGWQRFQERQLAAGTTLGAIKASALDPRTDWRGWFAR